MVQSETSRINIKENIYNVLTTASRKCPVLCNISEGAFTPVRRVTGCRIGVYGRALSVSNDPLDALLHCVVEHTV